MARVKQFNLPDPGEGLVEAEIVTWKVKVGDTVTINDIIVEIETAKSLVELPVPYAGTVTDLLVAEGETVAVGTPIIAVDTGVDDGTPPAPAKAPAAAGAEDEEIEAGKIGGAAPGGRVAVLVGYGPRMTEAKRRPRKGAVPPPPPAAVAPAVVAPAPVAPAPVPPPVPAVTPPPAPRPGGARALAKPPVRKYAKDRGVDLADVAGSGEGGIISRSDVDLHLQGAAGAVPAGAVPADAGAGAAAYGAPVVARTGERETRVPVKGVRKMTAQAMVASAFTAPHVTEFITVDVTRTMKLVERLRSRPRVPRRQGQPAAGGGQGAADRGAPQPRHQRRVGRGGPGDRRQELRQPGHRRRDTAGADGAQHQGRRRDVAAAARRRDGRARRHRP